MYISHTRKFWQMRMLIPVIALFVFVLPASGQFRGKGLANGDHYHFGYISGHVGSSILDSHAPGITPAGNAGGGIGIGYEYRNSGFWANVGLQLSMHRSRLVTEGYSTKNEENQMPYRGLDTQGKATTFHYAVTQTDEVKWNFVDVPLLFGYYTHGFHVGAGLKLSFALDAKTYATGVYNFSATNDDYGIEFKDLPEKGYTDYEFTTMAMNKLNVGAGLIGEVGYDLLSSMPTRSTTCHVLKLSFYFEYGLNNLVRGNEKTLQRVVPNAQNAREAKIYPYLNTINNQSRIVPFFAGAKLTYMIGGSKTARSGFHHGCMCYN